MQKRPARVTLVEVAKLAGVSPATVSNSVNGTRHVNIETKKRIDRAIADIGYVPNLRARRLRTGRASSIAVFSSMPLAISAGPSRLGFMMEIAASAAVAALEKQLSLVLIPPLPINHPGINNLEVDGALIIEPSCDEPNLADLVRRGMPIVSIGRPGAGNGQSVPYVDLQSENITEDIFNHFAETGARSIALFVGKGQRATNSVTESVYDRFARAHAMPAITYKLDESLGEAAGYEAANELLADHPDVDALFVLVDTFASGALKALKDAHVSLPHDMRLATRYDGIRARESAPKMTAFNLHLDAIAKIALDRLIMEIDGIDGPGKVTGPRPQIIIRQSSSKQDLHT